MIEDRIRVDIGMCTFRRPALAEALASLDVLDVPDDVELHVIVADNDTEPTARPIVDAFSRSSRHRVSYVHAPDANISIARNACLDTASGRYIAFIDDDETAHPGWIAALLDVARRQRAAAVLGPVEAVYGEDAPRWMRQADLHSTLPVYVDGRIVTGYTCNVLLDREAACVAGRRFDLSLGRTGGEDTDFFTGLTRDGGRIAYAPEALVREVVPQARATFGWLARRRFRMGQTHARIVIGPGSAARQAGQMARAAAKAGWCWAMAAATFPATASSRRHALRGTLHAGAVVGLLGVRESEHYGTAQHGGETPDAA